MRINNALNNLYSVILPKLVNVSALFSQAMAEEVEVAFGFQQTTSKGMAK